MKLKQSEKSTAFAWDKSLIFILAGLFIMSFFGIYQASFHYGYSTFGFLWRQGMWLILGVILVLICKRLDQDGFFNLMHLAYWILLALMGLLILFRFLWPVIQSNSLLLKIIYPFVHGVNNTFAWFFIPGLGSFQPSEFMKVALLFVVADMVHDHNQKKVTDSGIEDLVLLAKISGYCLGPLVLNFLQPDTGIPLILVFSLVILLYMSGLKLAWFIAFSGLVASIFIGIVLIYKMKPDILFQFFGSSYRLGRFYGWLDYEKFASTLGYQLYNALLALGSGGWSGVAPSVARVHIAEGHTDFIFAVIGNGLGLVGSLTILGLSLALDIRLAMIIYHAIEMRSKIVLSGILGIFVFQQVINIGMMLGVFPITGITLPFVSYGGSSLISYMLALSYPFIVHNHTLLNQPKTVKRISLESLKQNGQA